MKTATQVYTEVEKLRAVAHEVAETIDFLIRADILVQSGWTKIETSRDTYPPDLCFTVRQWVDNNGQGQYEVKGKTWLFELESDAIMFKLTWGGI